MYTERTQRKKVFSYIVATLGVGIGIFVFFQFANQEALAGTGDNVSGWAWSSNIGWVSFNCTDPDPDTCGTVDYGVHADPATGNFSGYAWSSSIGWIKFDPLGPYPGSPSYSACIDRLGVVEPMCDGVGDNTVSGWARACMGTVLGDCASATRTDGWDGWIKLRDAAAPAYGVSWNLTGPNAQELQGWAWGGDVVGWLSFNCVTGLGCVNDYFVKLGFDVPPDPPSDPATTPIACVNPPAVRLQWTYTHPQGKPQNGYQIQIKAGTEFSLPADFASCGPLTDDPPPLPCPGGASTLFLTSGLAYNTTYSWRVRVWDEDGGESDWTVGPSFTTVLHAYPNPTDFSHSPIAPIVGEPVEFCDDETCPGGLTFDPLSDPAQQEWGWDMDKSNGVCAPPPFSSCNYSVEDPTHPSFGDARAYIVTLFAKDDVGTCAKEKTINVSSLSSPNWREVSPF